MEMDRRRLLDNLDLPTILTTLTLAGVGIFFIASATFGRGEPHALWRAQLLWLLLAAVGAVVVISVDYRVWGEVALVLHVGVIVLLGVVLMVGREVGGNRSWLVFGPIRLQPSELVKVTTCLVLAAYLAQRVRGSIGLRQLIEMGVLAGFPVAMIAMQPDMGTALIFVPIFIGSLLIGGVRWKVIVGILVIGLLLTPVAWTQLKDYQKERILTVLDPERDPAGFGYQVRQSKIAIGSGGLTGQGLFRGSQNRLDFLPAQHTDFILAVLAEELGFIGIAGVLGLFYYLLYRGVVAARSAQDRFGTYLCLLVVAWIGGQMAINVGMVLGRLPTIGVPLPFVSYGGSALIAAVAGMAMVINVRSRRFVN